MVTFVAQERGEDGKPLRNYYAGLFDGSPIGPFPWADALFDCVLISANHQKSRQLASGFANQIVGCNVDWVQTTGPDAEAIHDLVDEAAMRAGRQQSVGDGSPMTSWHEEAVTLERMAEVAHYCQGGSDYVLCAVVGDDSELRRFLDCLRQRLSCPN